MSVKVNPNPQNQSFFKEDAAKADSVIIPKGVNQTEEVLKTASKVNKTSTSCFKNFFVKIGHFFNWIGKTVLNIFCKKDDVYGSLASSDEEPNGPDPKIPSIIDAGVPDTNPLGEDPINPDLVVPQATPLDQVDAGADPLDILFSNPEPQVILSDSQKALLAAKKAEEIKQKEAEEKKKKEAELQAQIKALREKTFGEGIVFLDEFNKTLDLTTPHNSVMPLKNIGNSCYMNSSLQSLVLHLDNNPQFQQLLHSDLQMQPGESLVQWEERIGQTWAPLEKEMSGRTPESDELFNARILFKRSFLAVMQAMTFCPAVVDQPQVTAVLMHHRDMCFGLGLNHPDFYTGKSEQKDSADYLSLWHQTLQWKPLYECKQNYAIVLDGNSNVRKICNPPQAAPLAYLFLDIPPLQLPQAVQAEIIAKEKKITAENKVKLDELVKAEAPTIQAFEEKIKELKEAAAKAKEEAEAKAKAEAEAEAKAKAEAEAKAAEEAKAKEDASDTSMTPETATLQKEQTESDTSVVSPELQTQAEKVEDLVSEKMPALPLKPKEVRRALFRRLNALQGRKRVNAANREKGVHAAQKRKIQTPEEAALYGKMKEFNEYKKPYDAKVNELKWGPFRERLREEQKAKSELVLNGEEYLQSLFQEETMEGVKYTLDDLNPEHKEIIDFYSQPETKIDGITYENKYGLHQLTVEQSFRENKLGNMLPHAFFLQFKRFYNAGGTRGKIDNKIAMDNLKVIDLNPYVLNADPTEKMDYMLTGFIAHGGTMNGGHYIAFKLVNDKWYRTSDSSLTEMDESEVPFGDAYILSYVKM